MTENLSPTDDVSYIEIDETEATLTVPADSWITAGRGNALLKAEHQRQQAVKALQTALDQAPLLRTTVRNQLQKALQLDPDTCGLYDGDSQVTLLTFAARVLCDPALATPFGEWLTWGLASDSTYATWTGQGWAQTLKPLVVSLLADNRAAYWDVRMPGHALSRKAYVQQHLGEHLRCTLELNYGFDRIGEEASQLGQLHSSSLYAQLYWNHSNDPAELCPDALLIQPETNDMPWLLYRPAANNPIRSFQDQVALLRWAHEHRQLLWPHPATPLEPESDMSFINVQAMSTDGLAGLLDSVLNDNDRLTTRYLLEAAQESATGPLDWSPLEDWEAKRGIQLNEALPEKLKEHLDRVVGDDETLAAEELHFDSLDERLPLGWRRQRIERQETLLATYLGDEVEPTSAKMTELRQHQSQLDKASEALHKLLAELPDSVDDTTFGLIYGETSRFEQLSQHFSQDLLLEARFQHLLADLSTSRLAWIEQLVERPEPSLQRPVVANSLKLVIGKRSWTLTGYLAVQEIPGDDSEAFDGAWLLHKSGHYGGLRVFTDQTHLSNALLKTLYGVWPETLLESAWPQDAESLLKCLDQTKEVPSIVLEPITTHVFDYLTQTQLALFTRTASTALQTLQVNLGISTNQARIQAFERLAQRNRTAHLSTQLRSLGHLDDAQRVALSTTVEALRVAMLNSSRLLQRDLPERGLFARNKLHERLRQSFSVSTLPGITLNIADRIVKERQSLSESGMANAYKEATAFSPERSNIPLEKALLWALDDDLTLRLGNAQILFDDNAPEQMRQQLNQSFVASLVNELDLAGAYEQQILNAFKGVKDEPAWATLQRQEILRAPFEHQLSIIALSRSTRLAPEGQQLLERFCQEQHDTTLSKTIDYFTMELMPGVAADGSSNRVDLSGIYVLQAETGPVLLLLPDAPNERVISQHNSAESACRALEEMTYSEAMRNYLASRPLEGDASVHLSYINTAALQKYTGFIGLGVKRQEPWTQFQANLQMGKLILENRASSRSQCDLFLEQEAIRHGRVYDYIKMAVSLVPIAGSAIALYDGWNAANASVEAFLRGDSREGVNHLNSVFLSMVDAMLDLAPGALAIGSNAVSRTIARQRMLSTSIPHTTITRRNHSKPFLGYQTEAPAGRWVDHPAAYGKGVFQHIETNTNYIVRQGRYFQVEWDETYRTWRLTGTQTRTYKQPVKLSEAGTWQTHGSLSGQIIDNGLAGGGAYLGTLYNRGWQTLRGYLRPQLAPMTPVEVLTSIHTGCLAQQARLQTKADALNQAHGFRPDRSRGTPADPATVNRALQEATDQLQEFVTFHEQSLDRLHTIRSHMRPAQYRKIYDDLGINLGRQHPKLLRQRHTQVSLGYNQLERLIQTADEAAISPLEHLRQVRHIHQKFGIALEKLEGELRRLNHVRSRLHADNLTIYDQDIAALGIPLDPQSCRVVRLSSLASGIFKLPSVINYDFTLMLRRVNTEILELRSALFSHGDLAAASLSRTQTHRFLLQLKQRYQRFVNHMLSWQDTFPDFITAETTQQLRQELARLIKEVDSALSASAPTRKPTGKPGQDKPRLFETVDQQLLIGREISVDGQPTMQVTSTVSSSVHATYTRTTDGKWQSTPAASAAPSGPLQSLVATANKRLADTPAQHRKLLQYKGLNMLPADLEDLAQGYAATLRDLAQDITRKGADALTDAQQSLVQRLKQAADELSTYGRQLRIEQIKANPQPGINHLQYLHAEEQVSIHWSKTLAPAKNKQGNPIEYLEEYRIDDSSTGATLWYAHFHFKNRPAKGFARLEAGHLKLASEVNQGSGAWRGPITESQATTLFDGLRPDPA